MHKSRAKQKALYAFGMQYFQIACLCPFDLFLKTEKALSYVVTVLDDNKNQVFSDFKFPSFDSMDIGDLFPNTEYTIIVFYHFIK